MTELRPLSPDDVQKASLKLLWTKGEESMEARNKRIDLARQMYMGELLADIPEEFEIKDRDKYRVRLPHGTTVPLKTVNVLQRKRPKTKRQQIGLGPKASARATKIENWSDSAMLDLYDWDTSIDWLFTEGEHLALVSPAEAHWEKVPSLECVVEELLPDPNANQPTRKANKGQKIRVKKTMVRKMYQRDDKDRAPNDSYYKRDPRRTFKLDMDKSRAAYDAILEDYRAQHLPWVIRIVNAKDSVPIFGPNNQLEAVIVRQSYRRNELIKRNYIWEGMNDLLEPTTAEGVGPSQPNVMVYEYYGLDEEKLPFVAYQVEGKDTKFKQATPEDPEGQVDAKINLYEAYGLTRLPAYYGYGWHFAHTNPAMRSIPFVWPFIPSLLGSDALATATVLHSWWTAFGGWFIQADANMDPRALLENGKPREITIKPMKAQYVAGIPTPAVHPGVGQDVHRMIALMMGGVSQEMPGGNGAALGGGDATSGHDRSLMRDYLEDSVSQVLKGAREMYAYIASIVLELACHLAEKWDLGVPVYRTVSVGPVFGLDYSHGSKENRELLTLDAGDAGINYHLDAYYPRLPGENMALATMLAEFVKQKLATFEEFRRIAFGDESPEETRIMIAVDEMIFETEIGRNYVMQLAFEYMGEEKQQMMAALIEQNLMTQAGMPTALMQGVFPSTPMAASGSPEAGGGNPGNVISGMGSMRGSMVSGAAQSLGGAVAGAQGQQSAMRDSMARGASGMAGY